MNWVASILSVAKEWAPQEVLFSPSRSRFSITCLKISMKKESWQHWNAFVKYSPSKANKQTQGLAYSHPPIDLYFQIVLILFPLLKIFHLSPQILLYFTHFTDAHFLWNGEPLETRLQGRTFHFPLFFYAFLCDLGQINSYKNNVIWVQSHFPQSDLW